jgi:hypothetical protein
VSLRSVLRFAGRVIVVATVLAFVTIVAIQYSRIVHRNIVLAHSLNDVNSDIAKLKAQREQRLGTIRRLEDPHGAIPEIHDRLHLTMPNESIIYIKGHTAPPEPAP